MSEIKFRCSKCGHESESMTGSETPLTPTDCPRFTVQPLSLVDRDRAKVAEEIINHIFETMYRHCGQKSLDIWQMFDAFDRSEGMGGTIREDEDYP